MNLLAHSYLSFGNPQVLVGNMASDFIKGSKKYDYPPAVLIGINLHRAIDNFTDEHPITREAKQFFRPAVGLYAGAFVDVVYDHFLALDTTEFPAPDSLHQQAQFTYTTLEQYQYILPLPLRGMLPYMKSQNWLENYRTLSGIENSFNSVARRAHYLQSAGPVFSLFEEHYTQLQKCYNSFFPSVKNYAAGYLHLLLNK